MPDNNTIVPGGNAAAPSPYGRAVSGSPPPPPPQESYQSGTGFTLDGAVTQLRNYATGPQGKQNMLCLGANVMMPGSGFLLKYALKHKASAEPTTADGTPPGPPAPPTPAPGTAPLADLQQNVRGSVQRGLRHLADALQPAAPPAAATAPPPPPPGPVPGEEWRIGG